MGVKYYLEGVRDEQSEEMKGEQDKLQRDLRWVAAGNTNQIGDTRTTLRRKEKTYVSRFERVDSFI